MGHWEALQNGTSPKAKTHSEQHSRDNRDFTRLNASANNNIYKYFSGNVQYMSDGDPSADWPATKKFDSTQMFTAALVVGFYADCFDKLGSAVRHP